MLWFRDWADLCVSGYIAWVDYGGDGILHESLPRFWLASVCAYVKNKLLPLTKKIFFIETL